jgi:hypothetical protein
MMPFDRLRSAFDTAARTGFLRTHPVGGSVQKPFALRYRRVERLRVKPTAVFRINKEGARVGGISGYMRG